MLSCSVLSVLILCSVSIFASKVVEGSQPVLQKTVETLFKGRTEIIYPGACKVIRASVKQNKMCHREPGLNKVLSIAKTQAITACEDSFKYDRWNCSLVFNRRQKRSIFKKIFRETAFVYALMAASITHAVAKACAAGDLVKCSCVKAFTNKTVKTNCGDDFIFGKRFTRKFLDFKEAGSDQIGEVLKQDVVVGIDAIGEQMKEVCKCHGFSGSCTTKTCWKSLGPFTSALGLLKKHYHHAVKKRMLNYTSKRAVSPKVRRRLMKDKGKLIYFQKTPNLCLGTKGRICKDRSNCVNLCCGRGFTVSKQTVKSRCKCRMVDCCFVECDTCVQEVDVFTCK